MNLFLQSDSRPLHFVGAGGAGMSALALVALRRGMRVTGSDADLAGVGDLIARGAQIAKGSAPRLAAEARAVIASAAIPAGHPDLVEAAAHGVPVVPRKVALAGLIGSATCVAIAGTHGKTTTTVMTTGALVGAGLDPTGLAGGRVPEWGGNARLGGTDLFVVEADEYDQAFLTLTPTVAVINNVEPDHLECYGSVEAMEAAYVRFAGSARRILVGNDGVGSDRVAAGLDPARVWRFGPGAEGVGLTDIFLGAEESRAVVRLADGRSVPLSLAVPGLHNLRNATAALGAVVALGADPVKAAAALGQFRGVGRRFERVGSAWGVTVVDDYAHHPTELGATLAAARQAFPGRRLVAVFQPHLYSRTALHAEAMGAALAAADLVIVADVYGAREAPLPGVTGDLVAEAARQKGAAVRYQPARTALAAEVLTEVEPGDVVVTLGAGDVTRVGPEVLGELEAR
ncbi:MAG: UDP-N-acetylmuramate--L-alanine ligase [Gemmatimonadetes bacterium]|nr:UDP-N-acetylmuramate--L-alanine ligase [Gemmatimonadota bacterium]